MTLADPAQLVDVDALVAAYYDDRPDPGEPEQRVAFGTSGHRGTSLAAHVQRGARARDQPRRSAATAREQGIDGPLFLGPRHARAVRAGVRAPSSRCSRRTASTSSSTTGDGFTPTPVISHAILTPQPRRATAAPPTASSSRRRTTRPRTAASSTTRRTAGRPTPTSPAGSSARPTRCSRTGCAACARTPRARPRGAAPRATTSRPTSTTCRRSSTSTRSAAPGCGSASTRSAARASPTGRRSPSATGSTSTIVNDDGRPDLPLHARSTGTARSGWTARRRTRWRGLIAIADRFDVAFANDPDADRHGIVTPGAGLLNPNHYLAVCDRLPLRRRTATGRRRGGRQDARLQRDDRPRGAPTSAAGWSRCRSASSGSSTGCSTARSASAARRAPARRSCAATARRGRPTRTA